MHGGGGGGRGTADVTRVTPPQQLLVQGSVQLGTQQAINGSHEAGEINRSFHVLAGSQSANSLNTHNLTPRIPPS